jgi:hypothetical protein
MMSSVREKLEAVSKPKPFLCLADLKRRGWTDALIRDFLGEPDKTKKIYGRGSAAPMKLFAVARVEAAEAKPLFLDRLAATDKRSKSARERAQVIRVEQELEDRQYQQETLALVRALEITVEWMPYKHLMHDSLEDWESWAQERELWYDYRDDCNGKTADKPTRERWAVNFARHHLTNYDELLEEYDLDADMVQVLRARVYDAIAKKWPELAKECRRQMNNRQDDYAEMDKLHREKAQFRAACTDMAVSSRAALLAGGDKHA